VIREALQALSKRYRWMRYGRRLNRMTTMDEFNALMDELQDAIFREYERYDRVEVREQEVAAVLSAIGFDIRGKSFLDIGPGFGSTLDAVRQQGAGRVEFAEYNPLFFTYNRLKGFVGYSLDVRTDLNRLGSQQYDVIWIKQTLVADRFCGERGLTTLARLVYRYPRLSSLLKELEALVRSGGVVIFCPHWTSSGGKRAIPNVLNTPLARVFHECGYSAMPSVQGHNIEPVSPVTFFKCVTPVQ
jgi:hypothetical protein